MSDQNDAQQNEQAAPASNAGVTTTADQAGSANVASSSTQVPYVDGNGNNGFYTLKTGETIDEQGLIQPSGLTALEAAVQESEGDVAGKEQPPLPAIEPSAGDKPADDGSDTSVKGDASAGQNAIIENAPASASVDDAAAVAGVGTASGSTPDITTGPTAGAPLAGSTADGVIADAEGGSSPDNSAAGTAGSDDSGIGGDAQVASDASQSGSNGTPAVGGDNAGDQAQHVDAASAGTQSGGDDESSIGDQLPDAPADLDPAIGQSDTEDSTPPVNNDPITSQTTIPTTGQPVVETPGTPGDQANLVDNSGNGSSDATGADASSQSTDTDDKDTGSSDASAPSGEQPGNDQPESPTPSTPGQDSANAGQDQDEPTLDSLSQELDSLGIAYKKTEKADANGQPTGELTLPLWLKQADFDKLVSEGNVPNAQALLNNQIEIDTTDDAGSDNGTQGDGAQSAAGTGTDDGGSANGPTGQDAGAASELAGGTVSGGGTPDESGSDAATGDNAANSDAGTGDQSGTGEAPQEPQQPVTQGQDTGSDVPVPPAPVPVVTPAAGADTPGVTPTGDKGRQLTDTSINQVVSDLIKDCSQLGKDVIEGIYQYIANMRPNMPVTPQEAARNQVGLYRTLGTLFNRVEGDFGRVFPAALKLFEHHSDGVFAETHRYRYLDEANQLDAKSKAAYMNMVHLMVTTAPVQGRQQVLKQIDVNKALDHGVNESGKMRVRNFLGQ